MPDAHFVKCFKQCECLVCSTINSIFLPHQKSLASQGINTATKKLRILVVKLRTMEGGKKMRKHDSFFLIF